MTFVRAGRWVPDGTRGRGQWRAAADRTGFGVLVLAVATAVVALPFAVASMAGSLRHPVAADAFHLAAPVAGAPATTALNIRLVAIDETNQKVTLDVTGDRRCASGCGAGQVLQLFSLRADPRGADGAPPSEDVDVPPAGEFDTSVDLPVTGGLGAYPFDHYHLLLGMALGDKSSSGQVVPVASRAARSQLDVSLDEQLTRIDVAPPRDVTSRYRFVGAQVALAATVDLTRPLYLQALTVLIIVFIAIAGVYSVVTRAFKEVIGTVGVVVLGVWGVRTLLVGSYPPDSTAVDLVLVLLILVLLLILMIRGLALMHHRVTGRAEPASASRAGSELGAGEEVPELDDVFSDIA
jgi:hypothetical protein